MRGQEVKQRLMRDRVKGFFRSRNTPQTELIMLSLATGLFEEYNL